MIFSAIVIPMCLRSKLVAGRDEAVEGKEVRFCAGNEDIGIGTAPQEYPFLHLSRFAQWDLALDANCNIPQSIHALSHGLH